MFIVSVFKSYIPKEEVPSYPIDLCPFLEGRSSHIPQEEVVRETSSYAFLEGRSCISLIGHTYFYCLIKEEKISLS